MAGGEAGWRQSVGELPPFNILLGFLLISENVQLHFSLLTNS